MELDDGLITSAALDALGYYNLPGGWQTGGFRTSLIATFGRADPTNRRRLADAFPELAYVLELIDQDKTLEVQFLAKGGSYKELHKATHRSTTH